MLNAIYLHRIARFLYLKRIPFLPWFIDKIIFYMYNSVVPRNALIGKGTLLALGGIGVVIHPRAKIGSKVMIGSNVTIGGKSGEQEVPTIGNNVFISTGAKILGAVIVGDNAVIGANAVVIKNVPESAVVGGVPAKILKYLNSDQINSYNKAVESQNIKQ